jgi:superfamily II DNA/RNA helicase
VFLNQKPEVDAIAEVLQKERYRVAAYHGGKSQDQRERAL